MHVYISIDIEPGASLDLASFSLSLFVAHAHSFFLYIVSVHTYTDI